ncbi:MAG TPA: beta-ketoacyl-[acyl-carrier-protein] synthase family protein [Gemmataceae bacterium]|jgi:3-oxoacyl-[acyl-carrier-protein] synthase II|nr:beta-ketoacyl-[acyl-carrier-protein] synthase family protein [Gemmataceae bacterium]
MGSSKRRAVITGCGAVTSLGHSAQAFWDGMIAQRSGIGPITGFDVSVLPTRIGGEVRDFEAKQYIDKKERKSLKVMSRSIQLAVAAAKLALDDSGVDKDKLDKTRFGVEFGAGLIASELAELGPAANVSSNCQPGTVDMEKWGVQGLANMPPLWMLKYLPNMLACHVSILHDAQGPNNSITEGEVASLLALGEAFRIMGRDLADFFLVGGADSKLNPLSFVRHTLFTPLSRRNDAPAAACRPFDRGRDGVVLGEGAGVIVLEDLEHARGRGATIYAEMVGFSSAFDAKGTGRGITRVIQGALREAGITADQVDHVNAHGLSSPRSDAIEARGIQAAFGAYKVPVFAPKSYIGSLGAGSGITEMIASLMGAQHGVVPGTLNYEEPDPECPVTVVSGGSRKIEREYFVKIGLTDMGQCAAVVLRNGKALANT